MYMCKCKWCSEHATMANLMYEDSKKTEDMGL